MSVFVNVVIIAALLGYAGWMIVRAVQKSRKGQCPGCSAKKGCQSGCSDIS